MLLRSAWHMPFLGLDIESIGTVFILFYFIVLFFKLKTIILSYTKKIKLQPKDFNWVDFCRLM